MDTLSERKKLILKSLETIHKEQFDVLVISGEFKILFPSFLLKCYLDGCFINFKKINKEDESKFPNAVYEYTLKNKVSIETLVHFRDVLIYTGVSKDFSLNNFIELWKSNNFSIDALCALWKDYFYPILYQIKEWTNDHVLYFELYMNILKTASNYGLPINLQILPHSAFLSLLFEDYSTFIYIITREDIDKIIRLRIFIEFSEKEKYRDKYKELLINRVRIFD